MPDPQEKEMRQAPIPPWLSSLHGPDESGDGGNIAGGEPPNAPLSIGGGTSAESEGERREVEREESLREDRRGTMPEPDGGWEDEGWGGGGGAGDLGDGGEEEEEEEWGGGRKAWGEELEDDERAFEEFSDGGSPPDVESDGRVSDVRRRGELGQDGGALRRTTMLDLLEGNLPVEAKGKGDGGSRLEGDVAFPPNLEGIMEEMRVLAQKDLDRKQRRHTHDTVEEDGADRGEEEEDSWDEDVAGSDEAGEYGEREAAAEQGPEEQAREAMRQMLADAPGGGRVDSPATADGGGNVANAVATRDGESFDVSDGREEDEEEYEDWTPLMHEGTRERTEALLGVVDILEDDAMEAARRADAGQGRGEGGRGAGTAVQATLRARLRTLTESHRCKQAIRFVEEEYPKEVREWGSVVGFWRRPIGIVLLTVSRRGERIGRGA